MLMKILMKTLMKILMMIFNEDLDDRCYLERAASTFNVPPARPDRPARASARYLETCVVL